jgi:type IV pilus assembly protein PilY1
MRDRALGRLARRVAVALAAATSFGLPGASAQLISPASLPWYVGRNDPPNILLTLDDSGSMAWAYSPDSLSDHSDSIAFKSDLNPMYFSETARYPIPRNADGVAYSTSYTAAPINGFDPSRGTVNLATGYRPFIGQEPQHTLSQVDSGTNWSEFARHCSSTNCTMPNGTVIGRTAPTAAYWYRYNAGSSSSCPLKPTVGQMSSLPASCFTGRTPGADTDLQQRFASWYSFYRTRNLATVTAAMFGFAQMPDDYRVAWQGLTTCTHPTLFSNTCKGWQSSRSAVNARLEPFDLNKRRALWSWLERLPASASTPLRDALTRAGEYTRQTGAFSPYQNVMGNAAGGESSCRATYSLMMTDGIWNSDSDYTAPGNIDGNNRSLPSLSHPAPVTQHNYTPRAPFQDSQSNTLADIAFHYWITDARTDLPDLLKPYVPYKAGETLSANEYWDPRNDPGTWQRMTSFFVGLGLGGWLTSPQWMGSTYAGTASPPDGYNALAGNTAWPTLASGLSGYVYDLWHAALNSRGQFYSADSSEALVDAFDDMRNRIAEREAGATAAAGTSLQLQADTKMYATQFSSARWDGTLTAYSLDANGAPLPTPAWTTDSTFRPSSTGPTSFRIFARGASGSLVAVTDTGSGLPAAVLTALDAEAARIGRTRQALLKWVLGDASDPSLRARSRLMGAVINSAPVFEGGRDYGYGVTRWSDATPIDGPVYAEYLKRKRKGDATNTPKPTVYVGSNDGMLHAFNGETGAHRFSYMPTPVFNRIGNRAQVGGPHVWMVDGQIAVHDVHETGVGWRTILIASMGAGARGLFALDVTDPDNPVLKWEWFPADDDLGFVTGEPVIARARSGEWVVTFGNGYGSVSNRSVLYVLNALTGVQLRKIVADTNTTEANGLSSPALLYLPGKLLAYAYAGDLRGNLWRFDIGSTSSVADWKLDFGNQPLFVATVPGTSTRQPITAKIRIATDRTKGRVLLFGTGRLFADGDQAVKSTQSVYGIFDRPAGSGTATRANLTLQKILSESAGQRTLSTTAPATDSAGWVIDLGTGTIGPTGSGERVVTPISYLPEVSLAVVSSLAPIASSDPCSSESNTWMMAVSPFTGRAQNIFPRPVGAGGSLAAGYQVTGSFAPPTLVRKDNGNLRLMVNGGPTGLTGVDVARGWNPRASWQQVR